MAERFEAEGMRVVLSDIEQRALAEAEREMPLSWPCECVVGKYAGPMV